MHRWRSSKLGLTFLGSTLLDLTDLRSSDRMYARSACKAPCSQARAAASKAHNESSRHVAQGSALNYTIAHELLPSIQEALGLLRVSLREVDGVMIEDNKYALSVHTRNVSDESLPRLDALLETALEEQPLLRRSNGKHVIELRPQVHWHKGRAVEWLLKSMYEQVCTVQHVWPLA